MGSQELVLSLQELQKHVLVLARSLPRVDVVSEMDWKESLRVGAKLAHTLKGRICLDADCRALVEECDAIEQLFDHAISENSRKADWLKKCVAVMRRVGDGLKSKADHPSVVDLEARGLGFLVRLNLDEQKGLVWIASEKIQKVLEPYPFQSKILCYRNRWIPLLGGEVSENGSVLILAEDGSTIALAVQSVDGVMRREELPSEEIEIFDSIKSLCA